MRWKKLKTLKMNDNEEQYFKEIKDFEDIYYNITSNFELTFLKPLNFKFEKKRFFEALYDDKGYNPQFKFEKRKLSNEKLEQLKSLKISIRNDMYGFKRLYKEKLKRKIAMIEAHKRWGDTSSTKFVKMYRGEPSLLLLSKAKLFCRNYKREKVKFKTLTPEIVSLRLAREVEKLTGDNINVVFIDIPSKVNINPWWKVIRINPHVRLTSLDVKRLKVHEIGVHYLRYFNAQKISAPRLLSYGTADYFETEEGLAVYAEEVKGVLSKAQMFIYAGRVIATYYALRLGFYEVFMVLKKYGFKDEDAYAMTYRAKRNISDTSQKGGFTKDYIYFGGYLKIKKYAKHHSIKDLFIGKIKIEDVKVLRKFIEKHRDEIKSIFD